MPDNLRLTQQCRSALRREGIRLFQGSVLHMEHLRASSGVAIHWRKNSDATGARTFFSDVCYVELGCTVRDSAFRTMKELRRSKEGFLIATTVAATTIHNDLN